AKTIRFIGPSKDESKIKIFGTDGGELCWKDPKSLLLPQHVKPTVKFGGDMGLYG
ncbi:18511_t:CDS:1, partial [Gigaspora rosea]